MTRSAQEVVEAHLDALAQRDPAAILKDFRDDAFVVTPQGALEGLSGIEAFLHPGSYRAAGTEGQRQVDRLCRQYRTAPMDRSLACRPCERWGRHLCS